MQANASGKQQCPFANLYITYQPFVPFLSLYWLELNIPKAIKAIKSKISTEYFPKEAKVRISDIHKYKSEVKRSE